MKIFKSFVVTYDDGSVEKIDAPTQFVAKAMIKYILQNQGGKFDHPNDGTYDVITLTKTGGYVVKSYAADGSLIAVYRRRAVYAWAQPYLGSFKSFLLRNALVGRYSSRKR